MSFTKNRPLPERGVANVHAILSGLFTLVLLAGSTVAMAETLVPSVLVPLSGTTSVAEPNLAGSIVEDRIRPFQITMLSGGIISGTIEDRVVHAVDGTYDFYWRVINSPNSAGNVGQFRLGNFLTSLYRANYRADDVGTIFPDAGYLFPAPPPGNVNFVFGLAGGSQVVPGGQSVFMFLDTDATAYRELAAMDLSTPGSTAASALFSTFSPVIPESDALAPSLVGAAGVFAFAVAKRKKSPLT